MAPDSLVGTSGKDWTFQPHPDLYEILGSNVLEHYGYYKSNNIDKTYIPSYFYLGGAGTGKSRHASEFASSVQEAITLHTQHPLYPELAQRLTKSYVFHVSLENGTSLGPEEKSNMWNAIGVRMLHQLLGGRLAYIKRQYAADPGDIFELVAAAANVNLYNDVTGILVVDGIQGALSGYDDGKNKNSPFYELLKQIAGLSLMKRHSSETKGGIARAAPFIMTCITGTCFGPVEGFLADSHRNRVYLPLNRLTAPTWKNDDSPVINNSPASRLLVNDVGGHARAIEIIADELAKHQNDLEPNIAELANALFNRLINRYKEAVLVLRDDIFPIVQCILSRQKICLHKEIPGSNLRWEDVTASGLIWFESDRADYDYDLQGYLVAPYIWLWMLARMPPTKDTERLCKFLRNWQFNDYAELLYLKTGEGPPGNTTWQSFERFCCSFRILRSLGFKNGQEVALKDLHWGCKLRDDRKTMVVNRHLDLAEAVHQYKTDSVAEDHTATGKARSAEEVETRHSGTLYAEDQLTHVILNGTSAPAGDFFLSIEIPKQLALNKEGLSEIVREVGQCKLIQKNVNQTTYTAERNKSTGSDDIFILYTQTGILKTWDLPDRSGLVDASCWDSYFGPFSGRAYLAYKKGNNQT